MSASFDAFVGKIRSAQYHIGSPSNRDLLELLREKI